MPQVLVIEPGFLTKTDRSELSRRLSYAVSKELHIEEVKDAHLSPDDIEVDFIESKRYGSQSDAQFRIIIFANYFPERELDIDDRAKRVAETIKYCFAAHPGIKGFVYIRLAPAGFAQF